MHRTAGRARAMMPLDFFEQLVVILNGAHAVT
jgi:hypothetical protein